MNTGSPSERSASLLRELVAWTLYPMLVLLPFAWLLVNFDPENTALLIGFAYFSLLTTGILEWVQPYKRGWRRSHGDVLTDIAHQVLTGLFAQIIRVFLVLGFFLLLDAALEDFALMTWPFSWPLWAQAMLGLVIAEFADYWRHRLFHRWSLAWRAHSVHHSPRRVYFLNANRFHILDALANSLASAVALTLCGANHEVVMLVGVFTGLHGPWQHANVRYRLGWLNWVFAGAELHRWHHSTIAKECDNNYGNNLIVWDVVFGTRFLPSSREIPSYIGLDGSMAGFPGGWLGQQLAPFRWRRISKPVSRVA